MKKLNILLLTALAIGLTTASCTKEDEDKPAPAVTTIVGKWTYDTTVYSSGGNAQPEKPYTDPSCTDKDFLDLKDDNTLMEQVIGEDDQHPCLAVLYDGDYSYEDKVLKINQGSYKVTYTVESISPTKLTLKYVNPNDPSEFYIYTLKK